MTGWQSLAVHIAGGVVGGACLWMALKMAGLRPDTTPFQTAALGVALREDLAVLCRAIVNIGQSRGHGDDVLDVLRKYGAIG